MISHGQDLASLQPPAGTRLIRTLRFRSIVGRLLLGAAVGFSVGFVVMLAAVAVVLQLTDDEGWLWGVTFGAAAVAVYVMPIIGALVELAIMVRKRTPA